MAGRQRIVSFLPSATEILVLIEQEAGVAGTSSSYGGQLVGRSHECDFPPSVGHLPVLTSSRLSHTTDSRLIHHQVQKALKDHSSLYAIGAGQLEELKPDLILTQNLCDVCSIDLDSVERVVLNMRPKKPRIVNLEPTSIAAVLASIGQIGAAVDLEEAAKRVTDKLEARLQTALTVVQEQQHLQQSRPSIELVEWLSPLFPAGHWSAEMLEMAGGIMTLSLPGDISRQISSEALIKADPAFLIVAPCGFGLDVTKQEMGKFVSENPWVGDLQCARLRQIYLVDGNQHFNRPGPRLVDAFEFLVGLLYDFPSLIPPGFPYERFDVSSSAAATDSTRAAAAAKALPPPPPADIEACHAAACAAEELMYCDPSSGLYVMTEYSLQKRGTCCGNGCRHCPYGHFNVVERAKGNKKRVNRIQSVTLLAVPRSDEEEEEEEDRMPSEVTRYVLFWSGGKDSYLALVHLLEDRPDAHVTLLTTFDEDSQTVAHQEVPFAKVMDQSRKLGFDLLAVPLPSRAGNDSYTRQVQAALSLLRSKVHSAWALRSQPAPTVNTVLVFGDLHLEDIRAWREGAHTIEEERQSCLFPVFNKPYSEIQAKLEAYRRPQDGTVAEALGASGRPELAASMGSSTLERLAYRRILVSAVSPQAQDVLSVGDLVSQEVLDRLAASRVIDSMGEDGSYHTLVEF